MKVLFLDIDGVLNGGDFYARRYDSIKRGEDIGKHPYHEFDPVAIGFLNEIIRETGCELVLSSSWRSDGNIIDILRKVGICKDIISKTPYCESHIRGEEIQSWLDTHVVDDYAILDDDSDMLDVQFPHFFRTDGMREGLNREITDKVISYFNKK